MLRYSVRVTWSEEDEGFVARCPEFPGVAADGQTYGEAIDAFERVLGTAIELFEEDGSDLPAPRLETRYSGNLSLRLGSDLHRRVAERAESEGTSINSLLQTAIACYLGMSDGASTMGSQVSASWGSRSRSRARRADNDTTARGA